MTERCAICGCKLHRTRNTYARPTVEGRSHATQHHHIAERFFGRTTNRKGKRVGVFSKCPWGHEGDKAVFCYECHEELLHNPVLLPEDVKQFSELVRLCGFSEEEKNDSRQLIAERIKLFHEVIAYGISAVLEQKKQSKEL